MVNERRCAAQPLLKCRRRASATDIRAKLIRSRSWNRACRSRFVTHAADAPAKPWHHDIKTAMFGFMRTTLTLDDDVAAQLKRLQAEHDGRLRDIVNRLLRLGLAQLQSSKRSPDAAYTQPVPLGPCLLPSIDSVADVLALVEGEAYR